MADGPVVIVGGGHAAAQLCASLHEKGISGGTHLVCGEGELPYQRPPLSKGYLKHLEEPTQAIRSADWFDMAGLRVHLRRQMVQIDRAQREVLLDDGQRLAYEKLVLATGTQARPWPMLASGAYNALTLRTSSDALVLRQQLAYAHRVVVLGGGFIGLEVAATARLLGKHVTLLEMAPRLMGRSVSASLAAHVCAAHAAQGIDIRLGVTVSAVEQDGEQVTALHLDGERLPCDLLLVAIGAQPAVQLAQAAGLACDNGVVVDDTLTTSDPAIYAIGDCAAFPMKNGRRLRLESIQNANDQARVVAARLAGEDAKYAPLPWFWSEQGGLRLQMVGLLPDQPRTHSRDGAQAGSFSLFHFDGDGLACVESVNAPMDHMVARKWLESGLSPTAAQIIDTHQPLKSILLS